MARTMGPLALLPVSTMHRNPAKLALCAGSPVISEFLGVETAQTG